MRRDRQKSSHQTSRPNRHSKRWKTRQLLIRLHLGFCHSRSTILIAVSFTRLIISDNPCAGGGRSTKGKCLLDLQVQPYSRTSDKRMRSTDPAQLPDSEQIFSRFVINYADPRRHHHPSEPCRIPVINKSITIHVKLRIAG